MATTDTNTIEKHVVLRASRAKVWRAISDAQQFGAWFGCKLDGPFAPGKVVRGKITSPGYDHLTIDFEIVAIEPETYFAYRWHPNAIDLAQDYSAEPTTLVQMELADDGAGCRLTIRESGFDAIPAARRAKAFESNGAGWAEQCRRIERHVTAE